MEVKNGIKFEKNTTIRCTPNIRNIVTYNKQSL